MDEFGWKAGIWKKRETGKRERRSRRGTPAVGLDGHTASGSRMSYTSRLMVRCPGRPLGR